MPCVVLNPYTFTLAMPKLVSSFEPVFVLACDHDQGSHISRHIVVCRVAKKAGVSHRVKTHNSMSCNQESRRTTP